MFCQPLAGIEKKGGMGLPPGWVRVFLLPSSSDPSAECMKARMVDYSLKHPLSAAMFKYLPSSADTYAIGIANVGGKNCRHIY